MNDVLNKPRVFLSHSKKDIEFIKTLHNDLVNCQIQPWMDEIDIQHGESWLDAIFEGGIAACDCILVYLTDHSIDSEMVKKEIDASMIQKLKDKHVGILLYVSSTSVRDKLRPDLQALHGPVWSTDNYQELLPRVVAEIWRYFMRRTVNMAINDEKNRRLEAELQLKEMAERQGDSVFSSAEEKDFSYIWEQISRNEQVDYNLVDKSKNEGLILKTFRIQINIGTIITLLSNKENNSFVDSRIIELLSNYHIKAKLMTPENIKENICLALPHYPNIGDELLLYGFIERRENPQLQQSSNHRSFLMPIMPIQSYVLVYTSKLERFKYWLAYKNLLPKEIEWKLVEEKSSNIIE